MLNHAFLLKAHACLSSARGERNGYPPRSATSSFFWQGVHVQRFYGSAIGLSKAILLVLKQILIEGVFRAKESLLIKHNLWFKNACMCSWLTCTWYVLISSTSNICFCFIDCRQMVSIWECGELMTRRRAECTVRSRDDADETFLKFAQAALISALNIVRVRTSFFKWNSALICESRLYSI